MTNEGCCKVKVLNLKDFSSRIISKNIDESQFPSAQYCEKGFYYATEKNDNITIRTKGEWDVYCRNAVRAYARGKNQPVFTKMNLIRLAIFSVIAILLVFCVIKYSNSANANVSNNTNNYTQIESLSNKEVQLCS